jgi:hypothetical protein
VEAKQLEHHLTYTNRKTFLLQTFLEIIETSYPLHAHFNPDTGILDIPRIDVPVIVPLFGGKSIDGPTLQCSAVLQQSALRPEVLMLKEFDCNLP